MKQEEEKFPLVDCLILVNKKLSEAYKVLETIYLNFHNSKEFKDSCMIREIEYLAEQHKGDLLFNLYVHGYKEEEELKSFQKKKKKSSKIQKRKTKK